MSNKTAMRSITWRPCAKPRSTRDEILRNLPRIGGVVPMYVDGRWCARAMRRDARPHRPVNGRRDRHRRRRDKQDAETRDSRRRAAHSTKDRGARRAPPTAPRCCLKVADADRRASRRVHAHRHAQQRQAVARDASTMRSTPPTVFATTPDSRRNRTAKRSTCRRRRRPSPCASRSASADRSCRGTTRCSWRCGNSRRRSPPATSACSSPPELTPLSAIALATIFEELEFPRRRRQHRSRSGRDRRARDRGEPVGRQNRVHRRHEDRPRHHASRDGKPEENLARARRQIAQHRLRGRRFRYRDRLRALRHLCKCRARSARRARA